jgi:ankyrin repeat protein
MTTSFLGNIEIVKSLIQNGADLNQKAALYSSALEAALSKEYDKVVELLFHNGAR